MRILVSKIGGIFRTREEVEALSLRRIARRSDAAAGAGGEQGETEGLLRWLVSQGHDVTYFGRMVGELDGVRRVESAKCWDDDDVEGDQSELWARQEEGFAIDREALGDGYGLYLQLTGYAACGSFRMPEGRVRIQAVAANHIAPVLAATLSTGAPRVIINNDPRCYPRDWEMTHYPALRPAALLDQTAADATMRVGGRKFHRRSVRSRCESWAYHEPRTNQHLDPCVCIAHAHVDDGIGKSSWDAWELIHGGELPDEYHVYGKGWEDSSLPPGVWEGPVNPRNALLLFNMHTCGPVVSHTPGFDTGKPYVMHSQGCVPLLFGDGSHRQTYDPQGRIIPITSCLRLKEPGDLKRLADDLHSWPERYQEVMGILDRTLAPDFTLLEELIDRGPDFERFGGYRLI